jgi:glutamate synthase domain-containing protein 2/glutamate synthase domain-containing protein 3
MLLAVGAVHHRLIRDGKRMRASIVVEAGDVREDHHIACLIGYGASAVNPYLAFEVVAREMSRRGMSTPAALRNYAGALESGLLKIMAKMGIASIASYCGAQIFEAIGLDPDLVSTRFAGTACRLGGVGTKEIARDVLAFHTQALKKSDHGLEDAGYYRYRVDGEFHAFNPSVFRALHKALRAESPESSFEDFSRTVNNRQPVTVRDLLGFRRTSPLSIDEVESAASIVGRFCASGMSHGALSREAHETIAIAMNRLGARSNSGEGGEDSTRYRRRPDGDDSNSRVKQVASARFGVTPHYLISAREIEIKISQGSKPGEGGHLPGHKVTAEIAAIRHSVPGVALISPPPHHDIYSIEDLAQLIYDLKQINPSARVSVKLVASSGVGTIAAGVAKAAADVIHIAGHDGGTGASPLGSIKNAGSPWELGLAEAHQVLKMNGLRDRVRLRTDGGLKTGRDIVIAAMLGADEFGFATAPLVALGCVMARQCHLNTCPVGIATQDRRLRERFAGKPEMVVDFFMSLAEEVRKILAGLGLQSLAEAVGRGDLLTQTRSSLSKGVSLDLKPLLVQAAGATPTAEHRANRKDHDGREPAKPPADLDHRILRDVSRALKTGRRILLSYEIRNTDRATGARLAGEIARRYSNDSLAEGTIDIKFRGSAGQSFGAFLTPGLKLMLIGEANDYAGKGMAGGEIAIRPPDEAQFDWSSNVIIGNTVMYGATGGSLFIAGRAGERFCVRNSGGNAVVEGIGDHGCEYMTAGNVVVLGEVGRNFAAGMTGGAAYVLDIDGSFESRCNQELVKLEVVSHRRDEQIIRRLVTRHYELTGSLRAREVFWNWAFFRPLFWKVITEAEMRSQMEAQEIIPAHRPEAGERRIAAAE